MSVNKVILIGHLGQDPEIRYTSDGTPVCNISVATSENWKDPNGAAMSRTEWHRVVFWRKLAEIVGQYLRKGAQVYIEGKIQSREYEDTTNPGVKRKAYEIIANEMRMLDKKSSSNNAQPAQSELPL